MQENRNFNIFFIQAYDLMEIFGIYDNENTNKLFEDIVRIVNRAYMRGEEGMWKNIINEDGSEQPMTRTNMKDIRQMINDNKITLAVAFKRCWSDNRFIVNYNLEEFQQFIKDDHQDLYNNIIILGSVLCFIYDQIQQLAELGMLSVNSDYLQMGIGTQLMLAAEERAKQLQCQSIRLEILSPSEYSHPVKEWLKLWYTKKFNYTEMQTEDFAKDYPEYSKMLISPCKFTVYSKQL